MCFSASASFTAAALTTVIGLATVTRITHRRELALAATPILFGLQQAVEGVLWLVAPGGGHPSLAHALTLAFILFAEVFWPVFVPVAMLLIEPNAARRKLVLGLLAIGLGVAGYLGWNILAAPPVAEVMHDHIVYVTRWPYPPIVELAYLAATTLPMILSSRRTLVALGVIVLIGAVVAFTVYWQAFVSVWCFFAAAASLVILAHFHVVRPAGLNSRAAAGAAPI